MVQFFHYYPDLGFLNTPPPAKRAQRANVSKRTALLIMKFYIRVSSNYLYRAEEFGPKKRSLVRRFLLEILHKLDVRLREVPDLIGENIATWPDEFSMKNAIHLEQAN